jgi:hypothetical protein
MVETAFHWFGFDFCSTIQNRMRSVAAYSSDAWVLSFIPAHFDCVTSTINPKRE